MKQNTLKINVLLGWIIFSGFLLSFTLTYRENRITHETNIENISLLISEGVYGQLRAGVVKPVTVSMAMAKDIFLQEYLQLEKGRRNTQEYLEAIARYLSVYKEENSYDTVFLASAATHNYYNHSGFDRVLHPDAPQDDWFFSLLDNEEDYVVNIDYDLSPAGETPITAFINYRMRGATGATMGIIGVGITIDNLQKTFRNYEEELGVDISLVDADGCIIISTDLNHMDDVNIFDLGYYGENMKERILAWREEGGNVLSFWADEGGTRNVKMHVAVRYLPEFQSYLIVAHDTSELRGRMVRQLLQGMAIWAVITFAVLAIVTYLTNKFNRDREGLFHSMERERKAIFRRATEQLFENIYELDITNNRAANRETEKYFESLGFPAKGKFNTFLRVVSEKQMKEEFRQGYIDTFLRENILKLFASGTDRVQYDCMISSGGEYYWMRIIGRIVHLESNNSIHMFTYRQNIDAEKRREEKMKQLSQSDEMTGLYTKTATERMIEMRLRENPGESYAFFLFDIDFFKQANDSRGHAFGDTVICAFAGIIKGHFRDSDVIGRVGGDEFAVFAPIASKAMVLEKAETLSEALHFTHVFDSVDWDVSASIGIAVAPDDGTDFKQLYNNADAALYQSKKNGRDGFSVYGEG